VALGGNALLRRGQPQTAENQRANVRIACEALAPIARDHALVVTHGNGPQVGLLALQSAAYGHGEPYPLDVLDAETEGMLGYMIEQELRNLLPSGSAIATLLTMVEVDAGDPAFAHPTKPIGPVYDEVTANRLESEKGWAFRADGTGLRRVVPSPLPRQIPGIHQIEWLLERECVVICMGGGGIPAVRVSAPGDGRGTLVGIEGVIDKDRASALLAEQIRADALVIATDVDAVYDAWGTPDQRAVRHARPDLLASSSFADGSMGPKVAAACAFARRRGTFAAIGTLEDVSLMLRRGAGTIIETAADGIEYDPPLRGEPSHAGERTT
jgi:carbamate kinase